MYTTPAVERMEQARHSSNRAIEFATQAALAAQGGAADRELVAATVGESTFARDERETRAGARMIREATGELSINLEDHEAVWIEADRGKVLDALLAWAAVRQACELVSDRVFRESVERFSDLGPHAHGAAAGLIEALRGSEEAVTEVGALADEYVSTLEKRLAG